MLSCGKSVTVYYRTRNACGIWQDVYIEYIEFDGPGNGWVNAVDCGQSLSIYEIMAEATEQLLIANPMGFTPNGQNGCDFVWRVMKGSCWTANFPTQTYVAGIIQGNPDSHTASETNNGNSKLNQVQDPLLPTVGYLKACPTQECCLEAYEVCIVNNVKTITFNSQLSQTPENCPQFCEPVCGSIYSR